MPSRRRRGSEYPFAASARGLIQQINLVLCIRTSYRRTAWFAEYRFHPTRKWAFDAACPELKIACEYQGGLFMERKGGHQTVRGMRRDWEKFNEAQILGWAVLLFGPDETRTGNAVLVIERAIKARLENLAAVRQ